ncbi:hypothetical protein BSKO_01480 [Bryopsis sp. KO-2023]|nr:hypothetical protein BSKO_01480 [Bryopsis sp. KO-2023]
MHKLALGVSLLVLALGIGTTHCQTPGDFEVENLERQIDLKRHYVDIIEKYELKALKNSQKVFVCGWSATWAHAAHLMVTSGSDKGAKPLKTSPYLDPEGVPSTAGCLIADLPEAVSVGEKVVVKCHATLTNILKPFPKTIKQSEKQRVVYEDSLHVASMYEVLEQTTTVILSPGSDIMSKTMSKVTVSANKLEYGPFKNVKAFTPHPLRLHYIHNQPYAQASKVVREIQLSLWGNIYVEETYELKNGGAQLVGTWSRLEYQKNPRMQDGVLKEMVAALRPGAHSIYFRDQIGNVSTSAVRHMEKNVVVALKPRYPLQKGWKTQFTFGYSTPLDGALFKTPSGVYNLFMSFGPTIQDLTVDELEVRVVLPEGSSSIHYQFPFNVKKSFEKKFWYFDTTGRPVLVLKMANAVPRHSVRLSVDFKMDASAVWRKPFVLTLVIFAIFFSCILCNRVEWSIGGKGSKTSQPSGQDEKTATSVEKVLTDRQTLFEKLQSAISAIQATSTSSQALATVDAVESQIKETNVKLKELAAVIEKSGSPAWPPLKALLPKERDLLARSSRHLSLLITSLEKGQLKKEKNRKYALDERKAIETLAEEVQDGIEEVLAALYQG